VTLLLSLKASSMINRLAENLLHTQQCLSQTGTAPSGLAQQAAQQKSGYPTAEEIEPLYVQLKQAWTADGEMSATRIIADIRNFVAADQSHPYQSSKTHMGVLSTIMNRLKQDGEENSLIYVQLNKALGLAVVSNGILNAFINQMLQRPNDSQIW
jgi:hypothetical protein